MSDLKQHLVALGLPIARTKPIKDLQEEDLKGVELHRRTRGPASPSPCRSTPTTL